MGACFTEGEHTAYCFSFFNRYWLFQNMKNCYMSPSTYDIFLFLAQWILKNIISAVLFFHLVRFFSRKHEKLAAYLLLWQGIFSLAPLHSDFHSILCTIASFAFNVIYLNVTYACLLYIVTAFCHSLIHIYIFSNDIPY